MNLEDFIAQSLSQIARGIEKANNDLKDSQAIVNPPGISKAVVSEKGGYGSVEIDGYYVDVHEIIFDVSVSVIDSNESGGKLGISVAGIYLGAQEKENQSNTSVSRIQFSIPMALPQADTIKNSR